MRAYFAAIVFATLTALSYAQDFESGVDTASAGGFDASSFGDSPGLSAAGADFSGFDAAGAGFDTSGFGGAGGFDGAEGGFDGALF